MIYCINQVNLKLLLILMDSNLWKKIGIKKNSSSEQQNPLQSRNGSEGSTFNLVRCLDNLRNYPQNQELGIFSSDPIKNSRRTNGNSQLKKQQHNKSNYEDLQIQYCNSEPADSDQNHQKIIQKQNTIKRFELEIQNMRNLVIVLRKQYNQLKFTLQAQVKKVDYNLYATSFTQGMMKIINSRVGFQNQKKIQGDQSEKCSKCKNSQKLVQLLTKQCWNLEQEIKQKINSLRPTEADNSKQDFLSASKVKLIQKMKLMIEQLQQKNTIIRNQLKIKKTKLVQLQARNGDNLLYFRQQIQEVKKLAQRKIEQLNSKNNNLETALLMANKKYSQLFSKYEMTKELNANLQMQKNSIQSQSKIYSSSKYFQLNQKQKLFNKTFSSQLHTTSFLQDKSDDNKPAKNRNSFKFTIPKQKFQNSSFFLDKSSQNISTCHNAFQKLDTLKREVQRKIKVSKLREK